MFEIPWIKQSSTIDTYEVKGHLLKRKQMGKKTIYEVWKSSTLQSNNLDYFGIIAEVKKIQGAYEPIFIKDKYLGR